MASQRVTKILDIAIAVVALSMAGYHLVSTQYLIWSSLHHRVAHLGFALTLVFLVGLRESKKRTFWPLSLILMAAGLFVVIYTLVDYRFLQINSGFIEKPIQLVAGIILVLVVIEATRRTWGLIFPIVATVLILYFFFGQHIPGPLRGADMSYEWIISMLGIGFEGVYGVVLGVSANMVFLFLLFGGLMHSTGSIKFVFEVAKALGKKLVSGPAQTAVISSSLLGTVTGASVANVTLTGSFTIPLMKSSGYKPEQAGAIEATSSTGAQITPPVMGDSAFLMASFLGIPYVRVMLAAIIPALLFYLPVFLGVEVIARKQGMVKSTLDVDRRAIKVYAPMFIIPLAVIFTLLIMRFTPMYAAFYAIVSVIVVSSFRKETRPTLRSLKDGFTIGAVAGARVAIAMAIVGTMFTSVSMTGLGIKLGGIAETLSAGNLPLILLLTMLVSIVLGCGVVTTAAYAIVAIVIAPVLMKMGVLPLAAHFFVFYFAIISTITPPIALTSLAATGIAGSKYWPTALTAVKLAVTGFIIPFLVVYNTVLLMEPGSGSEWPFVLIAIVMGLIVLVVSTHNYFLTRITPWQRLLYIIATVFLFGYAFTHIFLAFVIGASLFVGLMLLEWRNVKAQRLVESSQTGGGKPTR